MAEPLQNKALFRKLHIALFLFVIIITKSSQAQSLLLPGDIVFVSVSSTSDTFEFIPLITLEKGTEFNVSNGLWNETKKQFLDHQSIRFKVSETIMAGTPIKVGAGKITGLEKEGALNLSEKSERLFLYQMEKSAYRFVYAIGWGEKNGRRDRTFFGSDIPDVLKESPNTLIKLGNRNNYQYYVRYGASGTPKMLNSFVSNAGFWRGNEQFEYPVFGTSFNIIKPPVVLFDESFSSVEENSESTSLQVAIYEHDGSKLTVDVVFDTSFSSVNRDELDGFVSKQINFTGLIGDAVYEIEIPISNDKVYEGNETGIFNLQNLSSGRFGDFMSHSLIITDDEIPELSLEITDDFGENILFIHNLERKRIDLKNWELTKGDIQIIIPEGTFLEVGESLVLVAEKKVELYDLTGEYLGLDKTDSEILNSTGSIQLKNESGKKITETIISRNEDLMASNLARDNLTNNSRSQSAVTANTANSSNSAEIVIPGWKSVKNSEVQLSEYSSVDFFYWNELQAKFLKINDGIVEVPKNAILTGYFDEASSAKIKKETKANKVINEGLKVFLSASDSDKNGRIQSHEGLNLLKNTTNTAISVGGLISVLNDKLDFENSISVYKSSVDFERISMLYEKDFILPDQTFWVKIDTDLKVIDLELDVDELNNYEDKIDEEIEKGLLELEIKGNSKSSGFTFSFLPDDAGLDNELNLKMHEELYLNEINEIVLTGIISEEHFSSYHIAKNLNNITQIPLNFTSPKSGEFELSVKEWTDIPDGWVIAIEDKKEEKVYELDETWSFKFNYSNISRIENEKITFPTVENRFLLKVIPEALVVQEEGDELPTSVELHQNYPNPFNPATTISFFMPEEAEVKLSVFNIVGQPVAVLLQEQKGKGEHVIEWDASDMPSGIYIYQLEVGTKIMTRKMTLVK